MKFHRNKQESLELNITPLIDVVFLLLIFFMVTTTFKTENHLSISLPTATGQPEKYEPKTFKLVITRAGRYYLNGQVVSGKNPHALTQRIRHALAQFAHRPLIIAADAQTSHQSVVTAMQAAGDAGVQNFSITTQHPG